MCTIHGEVELAYHVPRVLAEGASMKIGHNGCVPSTEKRDVGLVTLVRSEVVIGTSEHCILSSHKFVIAAIQWLSEEHMVGELNEHSHALAVQLHAIPPLPRG